MPIKAPKKRNMACTSCQNKQIKVKCQECTASKSECIFYPSKDKRRKVALKTTQNEAQNLRHILMHLVHTLRYGIDEKVEILKEDMEKGSSPDDAIVHLKLLLS